MRTPFVSRSIVAGAIAMAIAGSLPVSASRANAQSVDADPAMDWTTLPGQAERPHTPWVFRCTFNGQPRTLVAALAPECWVAYDGQACRLARVWAGGSDGIELDGSVYNGVHGPNPRQKGASLIDGSAGAFVLVTDGRASDVPAIWKGYRLRDGHVELLFDVEIPARGDREATTVRVTERPEFRGSADGAILERRFTISGPGGTESLGIRVPASSVTTEHAPRIEVGQGDPVVMLAPAQETVIAMTLPAQREGGAK